MITNTKEWVSGMSGVAMVEKLLRGMGYYITRNDCIAQGKGAPLFHGLKANLVSPDLHAVRDGRGRLVEVKFKTAPVWWQIGQHWRTGIDEYCWDNYLEFDRLTGGYPVDLAFVHATQGGQGAPIQPWMFLQSLAALKRFVIYGEFPNPVFKGGKAVYWSLDDGVFQEIRIGAAMVPADIQAMCLRKVWRPWEQLSQAGKPRLRQPNPQGELPL